MSVVERTMACTPAEVFAVLADGWSYTNWVVGAARIREVEPTWPQPGSRLHHSVGIWPALLDDHTGVLRCVQDQLLELQARGWPAGEATVRIELRATGDSTLVTLTENATRGAGRYLPRPLQDLGLHPRNIESLRRLAMLAEGRSRTG